MTDPLDDVRTLAASEHLVSTPEYLRAILRVLLAHLDKKTGARK